MLSLHDLGSPGSRFAGSPSRKQRRSKVACLASPQVAGMPGRRVAESNISIFQYNARVHI